MEYYYLTFDIVCDEIESRVYDAASDMNDYSVCDRIGELAAAFALDYPEETAVYGMDVIESTFAMKADAMMCHASTVREPDYLALESEYFSEGVQLSLFA